MQKLHPFQKQALAHLLSPDSRHVVCISATGSGKTKIVEKWVDLSPKKTLFVSPLLALNEQQRNRFSSVGLDQYIDVRTPESLVKGTRSGLEQYQQYVVDECHTVFEWGKSFRPALAELPRLFAEQKTLWLTATLPALELQELVSYLKGPVQILGQFSFSDRIRMETISISWNERLSFLQYLSAYYRQGMGIVFCNSRNWCERISRYLKSLGIASQYYHAGLSKEEKRGIEHSIEKGEIKVLVSTIAFGLGMHVPAISWGVSWGFPGSFLSLSQMIGRVGRSHHGGVFYFLWSKEDELVWTRKKSETHLNLDQFNRLIDGFKRGLPIKKIIESELL